MLKDYKIIGPKLFILSVAVAFNAVSKLSRLSFYRQISEQLSVASLSRHTIVLQCYARYCQTLDK